MPITIASSQIPKWVFKLLVLFDQQYKTEKKLQILSSEKSKNNIHKQL